MKALESFLERPSRVLLFCVVGALMTFLFNGSFYQLWSLHSQSRYLTQKIQEHEEQSAQLEEKIAQAQRTDYIERIAVDQLDLVAEGDLIFVFSDTSGAQN
jgi:cell division protein FtsB